jgi:hypothetical protein
MKHYFSRTSILVLVFALAASSGLAQEMTSEIYVVDEQVYADLPAAPLASLLMRLSEAAGIELSLSSDIDAEAELYANGVSLHKVVNHLLPIGYGFALEMNQERKVTRLIVFSSDETAAGSKPGNERQRYLARQLGKRDDSTADIMHATLADRDLADSQAKLIAIEQLVDIESKHARQSLEAGIGDPDPQVRLSTAKALYRLQGDEAITLIGQIYYAEDSASIRKQVAAVVSGSSHPLAQSIVKNSAEAN